MVPPEESRIMSERAREPKRLVILKDTTHWEVYRGAGFEQVVDHALAWYREWLPVPARALAS